MTIQRNWQHMEIQDEENQNKNTTQYGLHTTMHKQTHLAQIMLFSKLFISYLLDDGFISADEFAERMSSGLSYIMQREIR